MLLPVYKRQTASRSNHPRSSVFVVERHWLDDGKSRQFSVPVISSSRKFVHRRAVRTEIKTKELKTGDSDKSSPDFSHIASDEMLEHRSFVAFLANTASDDKTSSLHLA
ncbi:hypothetical protein J6590_050883 [Homalodisca vitripennis]|nr:hypothetical protein J6590_050883 [Homalodisca vitripennis]